MQRTSFILAVALLVVATTLAVTITLRKPADESLASSQEAPKQRYQARPHYSARGNTSFTGDRKKSESRRAPRESIAEAFSVRVPTDHPRKSQLTEQAQAVEAEAKSELAKFTERLDLTGEQQRRLFPILARSSAKYDAAMMISGQVGAPPLVGNAGNEEFNEVLEQPQRDQLMDDALADQLLWQDIIGKLRERLDEQTPQVPEATDPVEPAPQAPRGRGNLFDSINPQ